MLKKTFSIIVISIFLITPFENVSAGTWGEPTEAEMMGQMMAKIREQITVAINSAAKMASIKQATSSIESLLYGGSSSPRNISNFQDFLVNEPADKAVTYGQDFLTNTLRGTTSGDYISGGGIGGGGNDVIAQALEQAGQGVIDNWSGDSQPTTTYAEHCNGDSINLECFNSMMSNPVNNKYGMQLVMEETIASKFAVEQLDAQITATSSGILPDKDENGNIKLPSSIVETIQEQQITLPLEALANGDSNVFSMVIQTFAISIMTDIVNRGLGTVQQSADKNQSAFESKYENQMQEMKTSTGPSANYSSDADVRKENSSWVNPDTGDTSY